MLHTKVNMAMSKAIVQFMMELETQVCKKCSKANNIVGIIKRKDIILDMLNHPARYAKTLSPDAVVALGSFVFETINDYIVTRSYSLDDGLQIAFKLINEDSDKSTLTVANEKFAIISGEVTEELLYDMVMKTISARRINYKNATHCSFHNADMGKVLLEAIDDAIHERFLDPELVAKYENSKNGHFFYYILDDFVSKFPILSGDGIESYRTIITDTLVNAVFEFFTVGLQLYGFEKASYASLIDEDDTVFIDFNFKPDNESGLPIITLQWANSFNGKLKFVFNPDTYLRRTKKASGDHKIYDQQCRDIFDTLMALIFSTQSV